MNILTIDLEEWYLYGQYSKGGSEYFLPILDNYLDKILDLFDQRSFKTTFFCLGIMAREYPSIIKKIVAKGHDIGCHSDIHSHVINQSPNKFREDNWWLLPGLRHDSDKAFGLKAYS